MTRANLTSTDLATEKQRPTSVGLRTMSRLLATALILVILSGCQAEHPLAGRWQGEDADGNEATLHLENSGRFQATALGEQFDGDWKADLETTPHRITFAFDDGPTTTTIFKLQGDNLLIEPVVEHDLTPESFSERATVYRKSR